MPKSIPIKKGSLTDTNTGRAVGAEISRNQSGPQQTAPSRNRQQADRGPSRRPQSDNLNQENSKITRQRRNARTTTETTEQKPEEPKKMVGPGFYIISLFTIIEDLADILFTLTGILAFIPIFTSIVLTGVIWIYMWSEKVDFNSRQVSIWVISFIIELIPAINAIPTYTIIFWVTRALENNKTLKELVSLLKGVKR
jgi:hypothetical protein